MLDAVTAVLEQPTPVTAAISGAAASLRICRVAGPANSKTQHHLNRAGIMQVRGGLMGAIFD